MTYDGGCRRGGGVIPSLLLALTLSMTLLGVGGCASVSAPEAALAPDVVVRLPAPTRSEPLHVQQLLTAKVQGAATGHSLLVVLEANGGRLSLVGFSLLGVRLFKVDYDATGIHVEQLPALAAMGALPPVTQVLSDVLLSYWPRQAWLATLPVGWQLQDFPLRRELRNEKGELISEIHYQQQGDTREPSQLWQHAFGYRLTIQTVLPPEPSPSHE